MANQIPDKLLQHNPLHLPSDPFPLTTQVSKSYKTTTQRTLIQDRIMKLDVYLVYYNSIRFSHEIRAVFGEILSKIYFPYPTGP